MDLYHGTSKTAADDILENGIVLSRSRRNIDFGIGFYLTRDFAAAKKWAMYKNLSGIAGNAAILHFHLDDSQLNSLKVKYFDTPSTEWADIIYAERNDSDDVLRKYDFVIGPIADGKMSMLMTKLKKKLISRDEFAKSISRTLGMQTVAKTLKALASLEYIERWDF